MEPGTLVMPEVGFWLNASPQSWKIVVENPSAKMSPFIEGGDIVGLGGFGFSDLSREKLGCHGAGWFGSCENRNLVIADSPVG